MDRTRPRARHGRLTGDALRGAPAIVDEVIAATVTRYSASAGCAWDSYTPRKSGDEGRQEVQGDGQRRCVITGGVAHGGHDKGVTAAIDGLRVCVPWRVGSPVPAARLRRRVIEVTDDLDPAFREVEGHSSMWADVHEDPDTVVRREASIRIPRLQPEDRIRHGLAKPRGRDTGRRTTDAPRRRYPPKHSHVVGSEASSSPSIESVDPDRGRGLACGQRGCRRRRGARRGSGCRAWVRRRGGARARNSIRRDTGSTPLGRTNGCRG